MASFNVESLCRVCMENIVGNSMPLMSKKKNCKSQICKHYEKISNLKVKDNDQLPQQLCLGCVSELNKSFAFREKCIRTNSTLRAYLDIEESGDESQLEEISVKKYPAAKKKVVVTRQEDYEEIEITQEMIANSQNETSPAMILEMDSEISNLLLNPTSPSVEIQESNNDNELVFIIQDVNDPQPTPRLISSPETKSIKQENEKFKCSTCEMEFVRKKNFDNHLRRFHNGENDEIAPENKRLRLSLARGQDSNQLKQELQENPEAKNCKDCGALYLNEKSLKLHEKKNACKQETYECDVCKKIFTDQKLFTDHTESHPQQQEQEEAKELNEISDPLKKFPCKICPKAFKMASTLKDHLRTHTGDKPFVCSICNRAFSQNTNLKQHLRRHTQIKPFKCIFEDCDASFVSKGELDSHNRKHTGAHPFVCEQCGTSFTTSSSLVKHRRIHSGERPYQCNFCPMRFTALGTLRNHVKTHTGEKPHQCRFCDRSFTQKSDKAAHERTHTGDRPFKCNVCDSAFNQSGTLKSHMKIHAKQQKNSEDQEENSGDDTE